LVQYRPPQGSKARARRLRNNPTDAEKVVWNLLRENFPGERFRRQVPIRRFIADFACHEARLVIEVDGSQHGGPRDFERTRLIEAEGYRVLRFWNNDVLCNPDGVATAIAGSLHDRSPPPTSPIKGEAQPG
jgi:very-short-patch-repair endonuclease